MCTIRRDRFRGPAIDRLKKRAGEANHGSHALSRRGFLKLSFGALIASVAVELLGVITGYLAPRSGAVRDGGAVQAGAVDDFPPGSVREFPQAGFFLIRTEAGGFLAVYRRCPHLGCTVQWEEGNRTFLCPCHAASFDALGDFTRPPVPRALDLFPVEIDEGIVVVDTSHPVTREHYSPDQLVSPAREVRAERAPS